MNPLRQVSCSEIQLATCTVQLDSELVQGEDGSQERLTTREADLLRYLVARAGRTVTREELLEQVWGFAPSATSRATDNTVRRLRAKVEADPAHPRHILTVHGSGYRFAPLERQPPPPTPTPDDVPPELHLGDSVVDLARLEVRGERGPVRLTASEAAMLELLSRRAGAVDRRELRRAGWGTAAGSLRAVDAAMRRLRQKIECDPSAPRYLLSVRGAGYRLELPRTVPLPDDPGFVGRSGELAALEELIRRPGLVTVCGPLVSPAEPGEAQQPPGFSHSSAPETTPNSRRRCTSGAAPSGRCWALTAGSGGIVHP